MSLIITEGMIQRGRKSWL